MADARTGRNPFLTGENAVTEPIVVCLLLLLVLVSPKAGAQDSSQAREETQSEARQK